MVEAVDLASSDFLRVANTVEIIFAQFGLPIESGSDLGEMLTELK